MGRTILAILTGFITWSILWFALNGVLNAGFSEYIQENGAITNTGVLMMILIGSVVISIISGYVTAVIARDEILKHTLIFGVINLAVGIFFQSQAWDLLPLWYHLSFLILLIPAIIYGGKLREQRIGELASA